ncbi:FtsW/RodA/SpoVE family cell cycle protein [Candidatus Roizmanbacteria bacterium]|nr:FtsW/RodA/SpoVE family cell cycle protein [Candidatus Roizmanbacteria bacterium]
MTGLILPIALLTTFAIFNLMGIRHALVRNELFFILFGVVAYFVVRKMRRHFFKMNAYLFYWLFILLLIGTYIIGIEAKGSKRWIDFYFFNFQGSEFFKIFFILFLADFLSKKHTNVQNGLVFLLSLFYFILPTFIILKQPDLGNAFVFFFIYTVMVFFSALPINYIAGFLATIGGALPLFWLSLKGYQKERILSFINPHLYQSSTAYNMIQAMITVGSGKFLGRGLGLGTQSRLFFLPENHTDFAFSSLIEQFGFFGGLVLIILYAVIVICLGRRALVYFNHKDEDSQSNFLYVIGLLSFFVFQVAINIGMNLGLIPVAGIALPFISYGGSALVAIMVGFALLP